MTEHNEHHTFKTDEIPCQEISDPAVLSKNPVVSVHMITYNHEPYIAQAIEGVLMQKTDFPIELIIGEDCSTDRTREIVLEYQKKHPEIIRVLSSEKNLGMVKNSFLIDGACRGKYIAYCEGDDFWHHPQKLQKQVDYLESHPDCGLVHSDNNRLWVEERIFENHVKKTWGVSPRNSEDTFTSLLLRKYRITTSTVCFRKVLLDELRNNEKHLLLDPKLKSGELPRWLYFSLNSNFHYMDDSFSTYRVLQESACHSKSIDLRLDFSEWLGYVCKYYAHKYTCEPNVRKTVDIKYFSGQLISAFHRNNRIAAKHAYQKLRGYGHRFSVLQWAYFFGAYSRVIKLMSMPFLLLRRIWLRWSKWKRLKKFGEKERGDILTGCRRNRISKTGKLQN